MPTTRRAPRYNRKYGSGNIAAVVEFNWYGEKVEQDVDEALVEAIQLAINDALQIVRLPGWTPFLTGDLLNSIIDLGIQIQKTQVIGAFGSPLHYALFQELGTSKVAPSYYLTRAGNIVADELEKWVAQSLAARGY